jgi:hypothetical protein
MASLILEYVQTAVSMEEIHAHRERTAADREEAKTDTAEIEERINLPIPQNDKITQHPNVPTSSVTSTASCIEAMNERAAELVQRINLGTWQGNTISEKRCSERIFE